MSDLARIITEMRRQIAELSRRNANMIRTGRVIAVDAATGTVRVDVGADGEPLVTPPIPWPERAGDRRTWNPPSIGEVMTVISPGGEVGARSVATYGGFTDAVPAPSGRGDATVLAFGGVTITVEGDRVQIDAPAVLVNAASVDLGGVGGQPVARIGDMVQVGSGSSAGTWPIVSGSGVVRAVG